MHSVGSTGHGQGEHLLDSNHVLSAVKITGDATRPKETTFYSGNTELILLSYALTKIKGVGRRYSNLVCKKADIDLNKRYEISWARTS